MAANRLLKTKARTVSSARHKFITCKKALEYVSRSSMGRCIVFSSTTLEVMACQYLHAGRLPLERIIHYSLLPRLPLSQQ